MDVWREQFKRRDKSHAHTKRVGMAPGVELGFITQRVTQWHNGLTVVLVVCLTCEAVRQRSRGLGLLRGGLALVTLMLKRNPWKRN